MRLIIGCGYLGRRVARAWVAAGHRVAALTRTPQRAAELSRESIEPIVGDLTRPEELPALPGADVVLFAVGHDRRSGASIDDVLVTGLRHALERLPRTAASKFVYISSTGVYGTAGGDWVDEESPCAPTRPGGAAHLAAEQLLAGSRWGQQAIVLRLAGIYGPGRLPRLEAPAADVPLLGYLNLIHVDDAVAAVLAAADRGQPPRTYNVSDGHPVLRSEYYAELVRQHGMPVLPAGQPAAERAGSARADDKRVCSDRLRHELLARLIYPTYREGLATSRGAPG